MLTMADAALGECGVMAANVGLLATAPFWQSDELEADYEGRKLLILGGYRRDGMLNVLRRFAKEEGHQDDLLLKLISPHPYTMERI